MPPSIATSQFYGITEQAPTVSASAASATQPQVVGLAPPTNASLRSLSEPRHPVVIPHLTQAHLTPGHITYHQSNQQQQQQQQKVPGFSAAKLNQAISKCMTENEAFINSHGFTLTGNQSTNIETYDNLNETSQHANNIIPNRNNVQQHHVHHHGQSSKQLPPPPPPPHYSRIDSSRLGHFDRYSNGTLKPIYSSMRVPNSQRAVVKSIDHDLMTYFDDNLINQQQQQRDYVVPNPVVNVRNRSQHSQQPASRHQRHSIFNSPITWSNSNQQLQQQQQRDIKSCDREMFNSHLRDGSVDNELLSTMMPHSRDPSVGLRHGSSSATIRAGSTTPSHFYGGCQFAHYNNTNANGSRSSIVTRSGIQTAAPTQPPMSENSAPQQIPIHLEQPMVGGSKLSYDALTLETNVSSSSNGSTSSGNESSSADQTFEISNSSEDENNKMPAAVNMITTDKAYSDFVLLNSSATNQANQAYLNDNDNSSSSEGGLAIDDDEAEQQQQQTAAGEKFKMMQMQQQLEQLTSLVNQALMNRDLNQLASLVSSQYNLENEGGAADSQHQKKKPLPPHVDHLNEKTKSLKTDLLTIKKMQDNLKHLFGDSMKGFMSQLNEKLKSVCLQELNEKIKLDMIVYKYKLDNCKIESELSELETVVDDLRENILKHRINVSIDDVECYALALSQVSRQLVSLKSTFSHIKEQFKLQSSTSSSSISSSASNSAIDSSSLDSFDKTFENK